jgi:hypothetical protein
MDKRCRDIIGWMMASTSSKGSVGMEERVNGFHIRYI